MSDTSTDVPRGLVLPGLQDDTRRSSLLPFLVVTAIAGVALIWPIYPFAGDIRPYVLGFPLSFAWVVGWLVVMFVALVLLYRADTSDDAA